MKFSGKIILFGLFVVLGVLLAGADFAKAKVYLPMVGAGTYSAWTNNGGGTATYDRVDEYPVYDSADYSETSTTNAQQSYNLEDANDSGTIDSVKVVAVAQYTAGTPSLTLFLRLSASETIGTVQTLAGSWATYSETLARPGGGSWSTSDITSLEAGFKMTGSGTAQVAQVYIDVVYKTEIQRVKYHVLQRVAVLSSTVDESFSFYIADPIDEVRSAFIEIKGVSIPIASFTLGVTVNNSATPGAYDATYTINATGRPTSFKINHDVTNYFKNPLGGNVRTAGNYTKYIHLNTNSDIYLVGAKLIITYSWVKPPAVTGAYKPYGDLISSTFDTGSASGAAFNSIIWKGNEPVGTKVKLQIAASNCQNGATNSPTCTAGVWGASGSDYVGSDDINCSASFYWEPDENTAQDVRKCYSYLNNKRYFRYKVKLCSSADCATSGDTTPRVDDVVINFSP